MEFIMIKLSKIFAITFLLFQSLVIFQVLPENIEQKSYTLEVITRLLLNISKVNHSYNFFTSKSNQGEYVYFSTDMAMLKLDGDTIKSYPVSKEGSIQHWVNPMNIARISQLQSLASNDTLLYNTVVRSEAMYFFEQYPSYPIISIEVLKHRSKAKVEENFFVIEEQIDTVYSNLFSF